MRETKPGASPSHQIYLVRTDHYYTSIRPWTLAEAAGDPGLVSPDDPPVWVVRIICSGELTKPHHLAIDMYRNTGQIELWRQAAIAAARRQFHL